MLPLDPKKMRQMLKMAGIKLEEVDASEVIIKRETGDLIIEEPQVMKLMMKDQVMFQVMGKIKEKLFSEEDVKLVMEQTGIKDRKKVEDVLKESKGDIAEAIMKLKS